MIPESLPKGIGSSSDFLGKECYKGKLILILLFSPQLSDSDMYLKMFGLQEKPFHITPNPHFIFLSKKHKEAFAHLLYGVKQRVGFLSLIGEVGTGKTTVLRTLLRQLETANYQVALIFNPCLSALELLQSIHREFGLSHQEGERNLASLHDSLNDFLLEQRKQGKTVVLVIDEAQNLEPAVLEQLRLLSNLETETDKLLQLIIVGQPELEEVLGRRELRQLKQRLTVRYRLTNMDIEDTLAYVRHRLKVAGLKGPQLFTDKALRKIYHLTGGLPRLINILCDRALLVAYTREQPIVDHRVVAEAQSELAGGEKLKSSRRPLFVTLGFLGAIVISAAIVQPAFLRNFFTQQTESAQASIAEAVNPDRLPATEAKPSEIDPARLAQIKSLIASLDEVESAKLATSAVLERWGGNRPIKFDPSVYHPLESALRDSGMKTIRFNNNPLKLLDFNTPAVLSILLPNLKGKRYLALLEKRGQQVFTEPPLSADGWIPVDYLVSVWFGKAVIPWLNFDKLPYVDTPGEKGEAISKIQNLLRSAGDPKQIISGTYDAETITAISDVQQRTGLNPDGRIGSKTLLQLYRLVGHEMPKLEEEVGP